MHVGCCPDCRMSCQHSWSDRPSRGRTIWWILTVCRRVPWLSLSGCLSLHFAAASCIRLQRFAGLISTCCTTEGSHCLAPVHLLAWPLQDALCSLFARVIQSRVVLANKLLEWGTVDSMLALMRKRGSTDVTKGSAALFLSEAAQQLEDVSCLHQAGAVAALLGEHRSI